MANINTQTVTMSQITNIKTLNSIVAKYNVIGIKMAMYDRMYIQNFERHL